MTHLAAQLLAQALIAKYSLFDWCFAWDNANSRVGQCRHSTRTISLSHSYVPLNTDADVADTILHEIAHALAGPGIGHGHAWQSICRLIGAKPVECYGSEVEVVFKYSATCPSCSKVFHRHGKPRRERYCLSCGPTAILKFSK